MVWYIKEFEYSLTVLNCYLGMNFINSVCIHSRSGLQSVVPSPGCTQTATDECGGTCGPLKAILRIEKELSIYQSCPCSGRVRFPMLNLQQLSKNSGFQSLAEFGVQISLQEQTEGFGQTSAD